MFCPKCNEYLTEKALIKTEVRYAPGNVPIEYVAICPSCRVTMGKVSWGQLTVDPELEKQISKENAFRNTPSNDAKDSPNDAKVCPHCGKPLPANY